MKQAALNEARVILQKTLTPEFINQNRDKHLITIPLDENINRNNPIIKLALDSSILKSISAYMGMLPVIENITVWYSPNKKNLSGSSQEYHLDGQDTRTLQLFIFIEDINKNNGPLVVVDADKSKHIADSIGYRKNKKLRRVTDEVIQKFAQAHETTSLTGPTGTCYIADTDRCFHYGSRQADSPRFLLAFQYYTPFAFVLPWKWWKKLPFAEAANTKDFNELERAVLGAKA